MALLGSLLLLLPPLAAAGCVQSRPAAEAGITPAQASEVTQAAAAQVKRCFRWPRVPTSGRRIVTRLRVRYAFDGTLAEAPQLVYQEGVTPESRPYAGLMAAAASMAVMRCSPVHLPAELYRGGWEVFELTFSPRVMV